MRSTGYKADRIVQELCNIKKRFRPGKKILYGKDYGKEERDYYRRDFLQREVLARLGTKVYRKVRT